MLKYIYDANKGKAVSDGRAFAVIEALVARHKADPHMEIQFTGSTENTLTAFRVLIKRGEIAAAECGIFFCEPINGYLMELAVDKDARLAHWPAGFADFTEKAIEELIDWN